MKKLSFIVVLVFFIGCATTPAPPPELERNADYGTPPSPTDYQNQIMAYFDQNLIDPYSALYSYCGDPYKGTLFTQGPVWNRNPTYQFGWIVCGWVNAKNRMGGYVGKEAFKGFFKNDKLIQIWHKAQADDCSPQWNKCSGPIKRAP